MSERTIETRRGIACRVRTFGAHAHPPDRRAIVYLHSALGLMAEEPLLARLAERWPVYAPEWPGYGEQPTEGALEDMLDFALHGWDVVDALALGQPPHVIGHSMGGMIAAEMACIAPHDLERLVLIAPAGLWLDAHPVPDIFATLPFDFPQLLFHDPKAGETLLAGGLDFSSAAAVTAFMIRNARRMGTAGKILFPIPSRRLKKRLYRLAAPTLIAWGASDRLMPPVYAAAWQAAIVGADCTVLQGAGHVVPHEQPHALADAIEKHLG
jgi:pimeloyl-ACP methyl ester carboxylesterase